MMEGTNKREFYRKTFREPFHLKVFLLLKFLVQEDLCLKAGSSISKTRQEKYKVAGTMAIPATFLWLLTNEDVMMENLSILFPHNSIRFLRNVCNRKTLF